MRNLAHPIDEHTICDHFRGDDANLVKVLFDQIAPIGSRPHLTRGTFRRMSRIARWSDRLIWSQYASISSTTTRFGAKCGATSSALPKISVETVCCSSPVTPTPDTHRPRETNVCSGFFRFGSGPSQVICSAMLVRPAEDDDRGGDAEAQQSTADGLRNPNGCRSTDKDAGTLVRHGIVDHHSVHNVDPTEDVALVI